MADRRVKRCSVSLIIRKVHIETAMRHHHRPVRMAVINESANNKRWRGCGEGDPRAPLVGMRTGAATEENSLEFPEKLKIGLPYDPVRFHS